MDENFRVRVLLSSMRAMLGAVTSNLRGVTVDYNKDLLVFRAFFDSGATGEEKEQVDNALGEIIGDLWQDIKDFRYEPIDLPVPGKMVMLKDWIFMRHEI